jgi:cytidine deaminase
MNKELIMKLIDRAREASENAFCPYTNVPVGCALLTNDNAVFVGCNIETRVLSGSASAGEVAIMKAVSEGCTGFVAICFYSASAAFMPFPDGKTRQLLAEFNQTINIVIANDDTYSLSALNNMFLFVPELPEA